MKNIRNPFARLFSVVMLLSLCCLFTACPDDHPKDNVISKSELKSILLKNKWILHTDEFNILGPTDAEYRQDSYCLYFMNETAGTSVNITKISDTYDGHTNNLDFSDFTYTIDGNEVTLKFSVSGTSKLTYSDGVLKEGSLTYYPSALNSSDYEVMSERKNKQQYEGNYEFDYIIGFDNSWPSVYEKGVYTHLITLVFGVPENTYIRGISQFGIAIYPTNGEIDYKRGFKDDVWVEKRYVHGLQAICYTGSFSDNKEHNFVVTILFTSNSKTAKFKYAPVFYTDKNGWTDGHTFIDEDYVPKNVSGDDSSNNNNGYNGNNNNSSSGSQAKVEKHTYTVNGVSFVMVSIPGGTFQMGSEDSEAYDHEKPVHQVTLSDFSIGQTEVTQELWEAVMGSNPSVFKGARRPVENVSWNDCQTFITKLSDLTGQKFRLPTEAEWEFAARGGSNSMGYKYAGSNNLDDVAWYTSNSNSTTHEVATKLPNELGLYDMSGNVFEWCQDWYSDIYYSSTALTMSNPTGPDWGNFRVLRGGSWRRNAGCCRVAYRNLNSPLYADYNLGLRLAL